MRYVRKGYSLFTATAIFLVSILNSCPVNSAWSKQVEKDNAMLTESSRDRRESEVDLPPTEDGMSSSRPTESPIQIEGAAIDGGRLSLRRRNTTDLDGLHDTVLAIDRQSTQAKTTPSPGTHSLERCSPRKRLVTVQRYGCRGTAVISVCEGACVTSVKDHPRRFPFLTTVARSCQVKNAELVRVRVVCARRSADRFEQRRAEGRADLETWNWLSKSKTLLSATSCHCTDC